MGLSNDLISQFVKATKDKKETKTEITLLGTIVYDGRTYVKLDGSDQLTPVNTTTDVEDGERVTILIKNHNAMVTGNMSSPAARTVTVKSLGSQITEFEIVVADKVSTSELEAERGRIDTLVSDNVLIKETLTATEASISELEADNVTIKEKLTANEASINELETKKLDAEIANITYATIESLEATNADIHNLEATYGDFVVLTTDKFNAIDGSITNLETNMLTAESADIKYANIDFTNISEAAITKVFSDSGIIEDLVVSEGKITGELVGVTIKGDLIEGNTVKADKLVVLGEDGLYYKLNFEGGTFSEGETVPDDGLHGSVIVANSITAEKINVDDLVAFDATIGGFKITTNSIYSGVKKSVGNTTRGIYLDNNGQAAFGDSNNFIKYYKSSDGTYKLKVSADSILFGSESKSVASLEEDITSNVTIINQTISDKTDEITSAYEDEITSKLEGYVDKETYDTFEQDITAQLQVSNGQINATFDKLNIQQDELDAQQTTITNLSKYINFSEDGITIGGGNEGDNKLTLHIDNDGIVFRKNGVAFGMWDGDDFYTGNIVVKVSERAQFGDFAFVPRSDGSLSFLKIAQATLPVVEIVDNVLIIKNTKSLYNGTTAIISDINSSISNTIATLEV